MKINLLNYNNPYLSGYSEVHKGTQSINERTSANLCDKKNTTRGYNVNFSGNPAQKASEVAAKNLGTFDKMLNSKLFGNLLEYAEAHPISCNALFSLVLAGILRPATIMALPGGKEKEKQDKINAAAHSVASGIIGFISATIIMTPFDSNLVLVIFNFPEIHITRRPKPVRTVHSTPFPFHFLQSTHLKREHCILHHFSSLFILFK